MVLLQEKIGDGLKTGALSTEDAQTHLARLEDARRDYRSLMDKPASRDEWESFLRRLDTLEADVESDLRRPPRVEPMPRIDERLLTLQRRIDDGRSAGRLTPAEASDYQARLDLIRRDYLRLMEGRPLTYESGTEIVRRLDALERDLDRYR